MEQKYFDYAKRILNEIGIQSEDDFIESTPVINTVQTKQYMFHRAKTDAQIVLFQNDTCRVEINFRLPEDGIPAKTFMDHCATIENTPRNHHNEYCTGPSYPDHLTELRAKKHTFAFSPWDNHMFYVCSEGYPLNEMEQAVTNAITLAKQFSTHLPDLQSLRYWKPTDDEVIAKAKEIICNANLVETDIDREEKAHWIKDKNSFFKGWFSPFNDHGRGTFDTLWPGSVDYAAKNMGNKGTFEYAVACILLENPEFIAKARKACRIREETHVERY